MVLAFHTGSGDGYTKTSNAFISKFALYVNGNQQRTNETSDRSVMRDMEAFQDQECPTGSKRVNYWVHIGLCAASV